MSIFSRVKKTKKAAEEPKASLITEPIEILPTVSSNAAPIDPTKPANNTTAIVLTAEEVRARIASNRKRQSDIIRRSAALSYTHSRSNSEYSLAGSGWQTHRVREPASIEAILREMPTKDVELLPAPLVLRGREPIRRQDEPSLSRRHSEEFLAYSNPREVPLPPPMRTRPPPTRSRSRRLTKRNSPTSTMPIHQDPEEYFSSSSRSSARDSASSTGSTASSATSTSSIYNERVEVKRTSMKIPNFSRPTPVAEKKKPELEISLPYSSTVENMDEEIKTAKSLIPTWRYEDLRTDNQPPIQVTSISPTHSRQKSWGHSRQTSFGSIFRRRNVSTTAF
ncbi:hypothetical protein N0V90_006109 [Kalmusia sp. IMI 367209]|nr:hypothetical protein N0V90_006109 [Kalmusia sp. IMI 367209]